MLRGVPLELKGKSWFDPSAIGRYVSALANSARLADKNTAYLVWGVDNQGNVIGTTFNTRLVHQQHPFKVLAQGSRALLGIVSFCPGSRLTRRTDDSWGQNRMVAGFSTPVAGEIPLLGVCSGSRPSVLSADQ
jgi:hypothetical protein